MEKRYESEKEFILKTVESTDLVREWADKIFHEEITADFKLPEAIWEWFVDVAVKAYAKAENNLIRRMILVKIIHTREVVRAGYDIAKAAKDVVWNEYQVGTVCLLHDISRFDQALLGSYSDTKTNYDHAKVGAKMIEEYNFGRADLKEVDMKSVIESVGNHSAFEYRGDDKYAKLTRDADKLALLRAMPEIQEAQIGGFVKEGYSEIAVEAYKNGEMVRNKDVKSVSDRFLSWLAWEYDMNYQETKNRFISEGIKKWMLEELKFRGVEI